MAKTRFKLFDLRELKNFKKIHFESNYFDKTVHEMLH